VQLGSMELPLVSGEKDRASGHAFCPPSLFKDACMLKSMNGALIVAVWDNHIGIVSKLARPVVVLPRFHACSSYSNKKQKKQEKEKFTHGVLLFLLAKK
jgi:hypothetical protein